MWDDKEIEIVDKYTYLGIPLHCNMSYSTIAKEMLNRGNRAIKDLFGIYYKGKINNLNVRINLFNSLQLVQSVAMNCCHVLGLSVVEQIKSFQMSYLRRLLKLPAFTPHYFLMLESQSVPIEIQLLKTSLCLLCKLVRRPEASLSKIVLMPYTAR